LAQDISIADSMDAMISDRPYRRALPMSHARDETALRRTQFDPKIAEVFLSSRGTLGGTRANLGSPFGWRT
jgi:HD-GYP domain-containing protein (c-di-GMP phosphodiesterase class II)